MSHNRIFNLAVALIAALAIVIAVTLGRSYLRHHPKADHEGDAYFNDRRGPPELIPIKRMVVGSLSSARNRPSSYRTPSLAE